nr:MAG TPA: hypothetical protein [Caudoviricetes sp.]
MIKLRINFILVLMVLNLLLDNMKEVRNNNLEIRAITPESR